jgi:hypothetical protein
MFKRRAQSLNEYAVLIVIVTMAFVAMQTYIKRGLQGKIKDLADQISPQLYESGQVTANYTVTQQGTLQQHYDSGVSKTVIPGPDDCKKYEGDACVEYYRGELTQRWGEEETEPELNPVDEISDAL